MQICTPNSVKTVVKIHLLPKFRTAEKKQNQTKKDEKNPTNPKGTIPILCSQERSVLFFMISWRNSLMQKESYLDWVYGGYRDGSNKKTKDYVLEKWRYHINHYKANKKQLRLYQKMQHVGLKGWKIRPLVHILVKEQTSHKQIKQMKKILLSYFHPSLQGYLECYRP